MKLNKYTIAASMLGMLGAGLGLSSCSDELGVKTEGAEQSGIVLMIPDIESAAEFPTSKATSEVTASEGAYEDLYLYVFKTDGTNSEIVETSKISDLSPLASSSTGYKAYKLNLEAGKYKFYLLGNISRYAGDISGLKTEDAIKNIQLTFTDGVLKPGQLPMACLSRVGLTAGPTTDGAEITIANGDAKNGKTIYADLTFLCSKVRYTILFDNSNDGISKIFGSNVADFDNKVTFNNIIKTTPVGSALTTWADGSYIASVEGSLSKGKYDADYLNTNLDIVPSDISGEWVGSQRAWQGIVYLPENTNTAKKTTITLTGEGQTETGTAIPGYEITKTIDLFPQGKSSEVLKRGQMYDLVLAVKDYDALDLKNLNVLGWSTDKLSYSLSGKPYELIVGETTISVSTSKYTDLAYRSDVSVGVESPVLNGKSFYQYEVKDDVISIRINPSIPYSELQNIDEDQYNYFHVTAGQLRKRIEVDPLNIAPTFEVTPQTIIVDVRELLSTGEGNPTFKIHYTTNVTDAGMAISVSGKSGFGTDEFTNLLGSGISSALSLINSDESSINASDLGSNEGDLLLTCNGILSGNSYWKTTHTYEIDFTNNKMEGSEKTQTVKIIVKPYTSDYVIHFKDNANKWGAPHIYVYQCLELPMDHKEYPGKTVGYRDDYGNNEYGYFSALEYAFTNDLSFRGWSGYGGQNNPNVAPYSWDHGFVHLGGVGSQESFKYKPTNKNTTVYNFNASHNDNHKENLKQNTNGWICITCKDGNYTVNNASRTWPGIIMEKEGNGWWKYTLTGVATPGKAMIMFSDTHTGEAEHSPYRYPDHEQVGVPLFDYPDNEGWFLYNSNNPNGNYNFSDDEPTSTTVTKTPESHTYRFYWPNDVSNRAYLSWGCGSVGYNNIGLAYNNNWWYYEFNATIDHSDDKFEFKVGNGSDFYDDNQIFKLSDFAIGTDGKYHGYVTWSNKTSLTKGIPTGVSTDPYSGFKAGDKLVINWYYDWYGCKYCRIYAQDAGFQPFDSWNGWYMGTDANLSATVEFTGKHDQIEVEIHNEYEDNANQPRMKFKVTPNQARCIETRNNVQNYTEGTTKNVTYNSATKTYTVHLMQ